MSISIPDSLLVNKKTDIDERSGIYDAGTHRAYANVAEANSTIPVQRRFEGLTVRIKADDELTHYWYKGGVTDGHLVRKNNFVEITLSTDGSYLLRSGQLIHGFAIKPANPGLTAFKIGITAGGEEISGPAQPVAPGASFSLIYTYYADADTLFYFGGIGGVPTSIIVLKH